MIQMQESDELLDLVDEHDQVIGTILRSVAYREKKMASVRAVWLFIKNEDGKLWIPRRHATKKLLPNYLDGSAVGHVSAGESYEQAMIREAQEELNLDVRQFSYHLLGAISPAQGTKSFVQVYEIIVPDGFMIDYNPNDFSEFFWLLPQEIVNLIEDGQEAKPSLSVIMRRFYQAI